MNFVNENQRNKKKEEGKRKIRTISSEKESFTKNKWKKMIGCKNNKKIKENNIKKDVNIAWKDLTDSHIHTIPYTENSQKCLKWWWCWFGQTVVNQWKSRYRVQISTNSK